LQPSKTNFILRQLVQQEYATWRSYKLGNSWHLNMPLKSRDLEGRLVVSMRYCITVRIGDDKQTQ